MTRRAIRESLFIAALFALSLALVGCGGGDVATSTDGGAAASAAGPAEVQVSFASAAESPAMAAPASLSPSGASRGADPSFLWAREVREFGPTIEHLYMDVVRVSLMPAEEPFEGEDMGSDVTDVAPGDPVPEPVKPRFVSVGARPPVQIDLLALGDGAELARLMDRFDSVPAGTYDKIRVYYRNAKAVLSDGTRLYLHPTAHSRFDIHFREGHELVIPAGTDASQPGWFNLYQVKVELGGVKVKILSRKGGHWKGCRALFRPQIFAEAESGTGGTDDPAEVLSSVIGTVGSVEKDAAPAVSGTFRVAPGAATAQTAALSSDVTVAFDASTVWRFSDDVLAGSTWTVDVSPEIGSAALQATAIVEVQGGQDADGTLWASEITITFPDVLAGDADGVGFTGGFDLLYQDNRVAVAPMPDRVTAYYDDATSAEHLPMVPGDITNSSRLLVRGYASPAPPDAPSSIDAWWISWTGSNVAW